MSRVDKENKGSVLDMTIIYTSEDESMSFYPQEITILKRK